MSIIDFLIGLTLMNAMPHFVLGIWQGRMFSGFGFGYGRNIIYGLFNFVISISMFIYQYGVAGLWENGLYTGALFVLLCYFLLSKMFYTRFKQEK